VIVPDYSNLIRRSTHLYGLLICLYPSSFRRAYGESMRSVFAQWLEDEAATDGLRGIGRVWWTTLKDFISALLREHGDARTITPALVIRLLTASLLPAAAYIALHHYLAPSDGLPIIAAWFVLMAIGMICARGRGWACSRNAMLATVVALGLPLLWEGLTTVTTPNLFTVAPLLLAAAATIGLICSIYVRLVIEGITLAPLTSITPRNRQAAFSLPELLIVIGIIALLLAILLPVVSSVRKAARDTACLANVHDLGRSYQMYLDGNRGKSFDGGSDATSPQWFELLQPHTGDLARMLLCPAATEPGNMIGSASMAWGPLRTYDTPAPTWTLRGTYVGSYGFNAWLWRIPGGQTLIDNAQTQFFELPTQHADNIPILADCIMEKAMPQDTDTVPFNLERPLPVSGSGAPGPMGQMAYFCIDRHRRAVNVVFLDGHATRVPLHDLWKLQWNRTFTARDVVIPP
jgi:prepilin-type N-terminal cleavage/methylation domain-containing protein/prepilin-type processing-associated H-X9-DG protein